MSDKATVAVIGCGGVAGYAHLPALASIENLELVGVCDLDKAKAEDKAARFGGKAFTDYEKMLAELRPQRVHVLTPDRAHLSPAVAALESGADVLVEMPMADTVNDAREIAAAASGPRLIGVDYNYRFIPVMEKAHQVLRDGMIGDLAAITCCCHNFCWHHCLDLARWLAGPVMRVRAQVGRPQPQLDAPHRLLPSHHPAVMGTYPLVATAQLEHAHGAITQITTTSLMDLADVMFEIRLIGTDGWLKIDQVAIEDVVGRLRRYPKAHEADSNVPPDLRGELVEFFPASAGGLPMSFNASIRAFHQAADSRMSPPTNAAYGLEIVAIETAARRSSDEGRAVALSEMTERQGSGVSG